MVLTWHKGKTVVDSNLRSEAMNGPLDYLQVKPVEFER